LHLADAFAAAVSRFPDRPFLVAGTRHLSYALVDREVQALATAFSDLGIEPGSRIATMLPNRPEVVTTLLAAARLGATVVPINPSLGYHELQHQLRHAGASVVVAVTAWDGRDYLDWFEDLAEEMPELAHVVAVPVGGEDVWFEDRIVSYADLVERGAHGHAEGPHDPEAPLAVLYTSGTMGKPKGVLASHRALVGNARQTADALGVTEADVSLLMVPHFTVFGTSLIVSAVVAGTTLVLLESFDAERAIETMAAEQVTLCHGVPTMFTLLLRSGHFTRAKLPVLRTGIIAGSPVAPDLVRKVRDVCDVEIAYGLTETGPTVSITRAGDPVELRETTVGRPLDGVAVRIVNYGAKQEHTPVGELAVQGPQVMTGYDRMPSESRRVVTADGYFLTGDLATVDAQGFVRIVGRRKETIIRGGFNVHPREVEDVLRAHPAALDICVVGLPHDVLGEMIVACVIPVEGAIVRGEDVIAFARESMADYKVPDQVRFVDSFPLNASGKVLRRELALSVASLQPTT
jgi:fatty-acyl-CoA synthase